MVRTGKLCALRYAALIICCIHVHSVFSESCGFTILDSVDIADIHAMFNGQRDGNDGTINDSSHHSKKKTLKSKTCDKEYYDRNSYQQEFETEYLRCKAIDVIWGFLAACSNSTIKCNGGNSSTKTYSLHKEELKDLKGNNNEFNMVLMILSCSYAATCVIIFASALSIKDDCFSSIEAVQMYFNIRHLKAENFNPHQLPDWYYQYKWCLHMKQIEAKGNGTQTVKKRNRSRRNRQKKKKKIETAKSSSCSRDMISKNTTTMKKNCTSQNEVVNVKSSDSNIATATPTFCSRLEPVSKNEICFSVTNIKQIKLSSSVKCFKSEDKRKKATVFSQPVIELLQGITNRKQLEHEMSIQDSTCLHTSNDYEENQCSTFLNIPNNTEEIEDYEETAPFKLQSDSQEQVLSDLILPNPYAKGHSSILNQCHANQVTLSSGYPTNIYSSCGDSMKKLVEENGSYPYDDFENHVENSTDNNGHDTDLKSYHEEKTEIEINDDFLIGIEMRLHSYCDEESKPKDAIEGNKNKLEITVQKMDVKKEENEKCPSVGLESHLHAQAVDVIIENNYQGIKRTQEKSTSTDSWYKTSYLSSDGSSDANSKNSTNKSSLSLYLDPHDTDVDVKTSSMDNFGEDSLEEEEESYIENTSTIIKEEVKVELNMKDSLRHKIQVGDTCSLTSMKGVSETAVGKTHIMQRQKRRNRDLKKRSKRKQVNDENKMQLNYRQLVKYSRPNKQICNGFVMLSSCSLNNNSMIFTSSECGGKSTEFDKLKAPRIMKRNSPNVNPNFGSFNQTGSFSNRRHEIKEDKIGLTVTMTVKDDSGFCSGSIKSDIPNQEKIRFGYSLAELLHDCFKREISSQTMRKDTFQNLKVLRNIIQDEEEKCIMKQSSREFHFTHQSVSTFFPGLNSYFQRLNNGPPLTTREQMHYEWLRLSSFHNYTGNGNALALARNGFYHDNNDGPNSTRCYLCEAQYSEWEMLDDIPGRHRRLSPNCPFHGNQEDESLNISITYGEINDQSTRSSASSSSGAPTVQHSPSNDSSARVTVTEVSSSLQRTSISQARVGNSEGESISLQYTEDIDSDRSMLALDQALGRTGHSYASIMAPTRNNVASGARSNVGVVSGPNVARDTPSQIPGIRPSSILGGPVGAGAFAGLQTAISRAKENIQQSDVPSPSVEAVAGTKHYNPTPGGGGRTDPNITVVVDNPKHPDFCNVDRRENSYQVWPEYLDQTPRQMAEAGFFFVGVADFTRCFSCGGGLRNWVPGDDPVLEHTRWFPRCEYINKLKGERYVAAVQKRHEEHMAEQQRQQNDLTQRCDRPQTAVSRAKENIQQSNVPSPAVEAAAGTKHSNPTPGCGGRTDPNITVEEDNAKHPNYCNVDSRSSNSTLNDFSSSDNEMESYSRLKSKFKRGKKRKNTCTQVSQVKSCDGNKHRATLSTDSDTAFINDPSRRTSKSKRNEWSYHGKGNKNRQRGQNKCLHSGELYSSFSSLNSLSSKMIAKRRKRKRMNKDQDKDCDAMKVCHSTENAQLPTTFSGQSKAFRAKHSGVANKSENALQSQIEMMDSTMKSCDYCHILLTLPNLKCINHRQRRHPNRESDPGLRDMSTEGHSSKRTTFLAKDSGVSTLHYGSNETSLEESSHGKTYNLIVISGHDTNFLKHDNIQYKENTDDTNDTLYTYTENRPLDRNTSFLNFESISTNRPQENLRGRQRSLTRPLKFSNDDVKSMKLRALVKDDTCHYQPKRSKKVSINKDGFDNSHAQLLHDCFIRDHLTQTMSKDTFQNLTVLRNMIQDEEERRIMKQSSREFNFTHQSVSTIFPGLNSYFQRLNNGPPLTTREQMHYEWLRLSSFYNYTGNGNALTLARNGFYHDHNDGPNSTRCYLCEAQYSEWEMLDDIPGRHRRLSPNCPFHGNQEDESLNVSITYGEINDQSTRSSASSSSGAPTVQHSPSNDSSARVTVTEVSSSLQRTSISQAHEGNSEGESISLQPTEDIDSDGSMLALDQPRTLQALGSTGHSNASIMAPTRNIVASGAWSNVGVVSGPNVARSTPNQIPGIRPSSILGGPVGAGAFAGPQTAVSRAKENIQQSNVPSPAVEAAAGTKHSNPTPGGSGRTDPNITVVVDYPKYPEYCNVDRRVNSYRGWPEHVYQTPRQMAEAGFFFVGKADFTRCFCCGGGLSDWVPGSSPVLEHIRAFPRCEYINKLKGERYVAAEQRRHEEHMAEQQRQQNDLTQRCDQSRNQPDAMTISAAITLQEMGYSRERTREAVIAVRQQTGQSIPSTEQVLTWLLDSEERETSGGLTRELGVRPQPSSASTEGTSTTSSSANTGNSAPTTIVGTSNSSTIISTPTTSVGTSIPSSIVNAPTTIVGTNASSSESTGKPKKKNGKKKGKNKPKSEMAGATGGDVDAKSLKEENEKLKEMQTCKICMERAVNTTLLPCGHLVCCETCAGRLQKCPICRKKIKSTVKTFMS